MKQISMVFQFKLPDDFKGGVPEALRILARFLETKSKPLPKNKLIPPKIPIKELYPVWCEIVNNGGKFAGSIGLQRYSEKLKKWIDLPMGIK